MRQLFYFLMGTCLLVSCGENTTEVKESEPIKPKEVQVDTDKMEKIAEASKVIYAMPTPMEMASLLKKAKLPYLADMLTNPSNSQQFVTNFDLATNLGIYFTDLSYASQFNDYQTVINYMKVIQQMTDKMGIPGVLNESVTARLEANMNNKDSIVNIVSEVYFSLDSSLKEDEKHEGAALVFSGAWIEGMYLALNLYHDSKNEELNKRMAEQYRSLDNLLSFLNEFPGNVKLVDLRKDLTDLRALFPEKKANTGKPAVKNENGKNVIVINNEGISFTPEQLGEFEKEITYLRTKIAKL